MHKNIIVLFVCAIILSFLLQDQFTTVHYAGPKEAHVTTGPTPTPSPLPQSAQIEGGTHAFQTFNNCGPASLSMALSLLGVTVSQEEIGNDLRPYQIPNGDNDDKSVVFRELADKALEYDFIPFHRPAGDSGILKSFIAEDIPVITRTLLDRDSDIGHYRVVKGYDTSGQFLQDDSLEGEDLWFSEEHFLGLWKAYNYEYLVLVPKEKEEIALQILGEDANPEHAWKKAALLSENAINASPEDLYARLNLSVAYYHLGKYEDSIREYEMISSRLPFRTLWYQIEPILAYYELLEYDKALSMSEAILSNQNRAFSELYHIRSVIFEKKGDFMSAERERQKAIKYNKNYFKNAPLEIS